MVALKIWALSQSAHIQQIQLFVARPDTLFSLSCLKFIWSEQFGATVIKSFFSAISIKLQIMTNFPWEFSVPPTIPSGILIQKRNAYCKLHLRLGKEIRNFVWLSAVISQFYSIRSVPPKCFCYRLVSKVHAMSV